MPLTLISRHLIVWVLHEAIIPLLYLGANVCIDLSDGIAQGYFGDAIFHLVSRIHAQSSQDTDISGWMNEPESCAKDLASSLAKSSHAGRPVSRLDCANVVGTQSRTKAVVT